MEQEEESPLVLVVDDLQEDRETIAELLVIAGFRVEVAADGVEAIQKVLDLQPSLVLMDLLLPKIDGWEAIHLLKDDERTRRIPIVAMTAAVTREDAERAIAAGCDGFMGKPYAPATLVSKVSWMLRKLVTPA